MNVLLGDPLQPETERGSDRRQRQPLLLTALDKYGVPSVIALYLVYRLTNGIPTSADVQDVKSAALAVQQSLSGHVTTTASDMLVLKALLRQICFNTGKTENDREACRGLGR